MSRKPVGYWTKEKCQEEALKYKTKKEFQKNSSAYGISAKNKWINEVCSHMLEIKKPKNYWTKEKCQKEALKYRTKNEFKDNSLSCYTKCLREKCWI
jgi:hypothetical protein